MIKHFRVNTRLSNHWVPSRTMSGKKSRTSMVSSQIVLVSGASRGIGASLASWFLSRGAKVEGCSRSTGSITHASYHHHTVDISDEEQVLAMLSCIRRRQGKVD